MLKRQARSQPSSSSTQTPAHLLLYIAIGVLFFGALVVMAAMDASDDAARVFLWTTVGGGVVLAANVPMFWRRRNRLRFWVVFVAIVAIHVTVYLVLFAPYMRQVPIFFFAAVMLPVESALVYLGFHVGLRGQARARRSKRA